MHSLRTKITMLTVWLTIFAVAAVTLLSVIVIRKTERTESEQLLLLMCETGERNLDYYFNSVEQSVRKVATYAEKQLGDLTDEELERQTWLVRAYFDEIAWKTNGVLTYYYRIDPAVSKKEKGFWYTNLDGTGFVEHEVTDISQYDTTDTSTLVWFTVPKNTGKPIWQSPYITENLGARVISYNYPIYNRGRFTGVIGIEIDYAMVMNQVETIKVYDSGYAFLTDARGSLICHPRMDLAGMTEEQKPVLPEGLLNESTNTEYTYKGIRKNAMWLRLTNGMRLYVCVPVNETDGDWQRLIRDVLILGAVVVVMSVLLARIFSVRITEPLRELTEAAKLANQGNYDFTLDYKGKDEVGTLTSTFKRMAAHMKEHIKDLNKKVFVDALTSVRNKGGFNNYIDDMQARIDAGEMDTEFAVGMFDCDDLKTVNDKYGHDKGDLYLKNACRVICKTFQHSPVFRVGGDEFAVVLRGNDYRNRQELKEEFEKATAETCTTAENRWEQVRVAVGITAFNPETDQTVIDTIRRADKVMYADKRKHKEEGGVR